MINQKDAVPFSHYQQLFSGLDPAEVPARLPGTAWDGTAFTVLLLGRAYRITHPDGAVCSSDDGQIPSLPVQTFLLRWLLTGQAIPSGGQWRTFRELPWGELYAAPFAGRVLKRAAFTFGKDPDAFRRAAKSLGGEPVPRGDAGYRFTLVGPYQLQLQIWAGDEEFPPGAQILYSDNFTLGFSAEDRVVAGDLLIAALKDKM